MVLNIYTVINFFFFFQAEDGIRDKLVTGVQTCALPIWRPLQACRARAPPAARSGARARERRPPGAAPPPARPAARVPRSSLYLQGLRQIGRASCRERVEISVVAV